MGAARWRCRLPSRADHALPAVQVWLENEHVRLMVLPQLGGRIHVGQVGLLPGRRLLCCCLPC